MDAGARFTTTRTGLRIGCCARRAPSPSMDDDAIRLQRALLGKRSTTTRVIRALLSALKGGIR